MTLWSTLCCCFLFFRSSQAQEFFGCGGFIKSEAVINFSLIEIKLYTKQGTLKYSTDCAPNNGYYLIPVYDKGEYIIKVESQSGWSFEPSQVEVTVDGANDVCSKGEDVNFQFQGLTLEGQVVSAGDTTGPSDVQVVITSPGTETEAAKTTTDSTGKYSFTSILPGDYVVAAFHPDLEFGTSSLQVTITADDSTIDALITVSGYSVKGSVVSEGEPIRGVKFVLHSDSGVVPRGCLTTDIPVLPAGGRAICYATSGEDGVFDFPLLPNGDYSIVPHYVGESIQFDVLPPLLDFKVAHRHAIIEQVFRVEGFTVQGSVRVTSSGTPISGAAISLDGAVLTSTNDAGVYELENIKTGTYTINVASAEGSGYYFSPTVIKITPNTPLLPEILPTSFDVCGRISVQQIPPALKAGFASRSRAVLVRAGDVVVATLGTRADGGEFCTRLAAGDYVVTPVVTEEETAHGFVLSPSHAPVTVTHAPVRHVAFAQTMGVLRGAVHCLDDCLSGSEEDPMRVILAPLARPESVVVLQVEAGEVETKASFQAAKLLPGKYNVSIVKKSFCWEEESVVVETVLETAAAEGAVAPVVFTQSGFRLSCDISHDTRLDFELEKKGEEASPNSEDNVVGSFSLVKGLNRFCLSRPGIYSLTPKSDCHQFEHDVYQFKTWTSFPTLRLAAVKHALVAEIHSDVEVDDLSVTMTSLVDASGVVVGPLGLASRVGADFVYGLRHWGRNGETFNLKPFAGNLLFKPESATVTIKGEEDCRGAPTVVRGIKGIFISGRVVPAIANVRVVIVPKKSPELRLVVDTDENGHYRVGPQDGSTDYSVRAEKPNFIFTPFDDDPFSFNAFKLGQIKVEVFEGEDSSSVLGGVLLSLSGGQGYRSNNMTNEGGGLAFTNLSPGQYFLRPMKKEYQFEPPNQMLDVAEGTTVNLKIIGRRVAFSIFGSVNSLNGDGESGISVEAFGSSEVAGCSVAQEEAKTDAGGAFRIRGLKPGCKYQIRVKSPETCPGNGLLERTTPVEIPILMPSRDLYNLTFIALRKMKDMDVSGKVVTSIEYVSSLKAKLFNEDNEDSPVHTIALGAVVPFFFFPSIPIDDKRYVIIVESNLPRHRYAYPDQIKTSFVANRPHQHFVFEFAPTLKPLDLDVSLQSSGLFTFPVVVLLLVAAYYHASLLSLSSVALAWLTGVAREALTSAGGEDGHDGLKRKRKAFKEQ